METDLDRLKHVEKLMTHAEAVQKSITQLQADLILTLKDLHEEFALLRRKVGVQRTTPATAEEVDNALLEEADVRERRTSTRRTDNPVMVIVADMQGGSKTFEAWVVDRSQGGLCLLSEQSVAAGSTLNVRPYSCNSNFRWVRVRVKNCRPNQDKWKLGCRFEERLTTRDLREFG